jgi:hypothetical protein
MAFRVQPGNVFQSATIDTPPSSPELQYVRYNV